MKKYVKKLKPNKIMLMSNIKIKLATQKTEKNKNDSHKKKSRNKKTNRIDKD